MIKRNNKQTESQRHIWTGQEIQGIDSLNPWPAWHKHNTESGGVWPYASDGAMTTDWGGIPRKIGWVCAARCPNPYPIWGQTVRFSIFTAWPKFDALFKTWPLNQNPFQTCLKVSYLFHTNVKGNIYMLLLGTIASSKNILSSRRLGCKNETLF